MAKFRKAYKHLFGTTEGKKQFCKAKAKERVVLKWMFKQCNGRSACCVYQDQDSGQLWWPVDVVVKLRVGITLDP
jgi:hypothetical protein